MVTTPHDTAKKKQARLQAEKKEFLGATLVYTHVVDARRGDDGGDGV